MNIVVVFAGGTGQRMNTTSKPKQFLEIHGKPIIIYTLENFERHSQIDGIIVVCLESWIGYMNDLLKRFGITKVKAVVPGGDTGQHSIRNGIYKAKDIFPEDAVVLIHDGVRPLINEKIISDNIKGVKNNGSAITVSPAIETIILKPEEGVDKVQDVMDRSRCMMARAPQSFFLKDIYEVHKKADAENYASAIDSAMLMRRYGMPLYTVEGIPENIKITTPSDFYIFRAIIDAKENSQIFGI